MPRDLIDEEEKTKSNPPIFDPLIDAKSDSEVERREGEGERGGDCF